MTIEVWRGLSVDRCFGLELSRLCAGDRLSPNRHRWWAQRRGIAEAYATTGNGTPVLLRAKLELERVPTSPCLPALPPSAVLWLTKVIWL